MSFTHDAEIPPFVPLEEPPIAEMAREYSPIMEAFAKVDPVLAAATFGALLAWPELHANVIRLEALVHLALAYSVGHEPPSTALVKESFDRLNEGYCGLAEDPAENVFVTLVSTSRGNFRIFQGIRESPGFFLQRLLNVVETIPYDGPFTHLHESINALLKISDAIAQRMGIAEDTLGNETPADVFPSTLRDRLAQARDLVCFSDADLADLGVEKGWLSEFIYPLEANAMLRRQIISHSDLERRPLASYQGSYFVLLPTAISTAISRLLIETVTSLDRVRVFESQLALEYSRMLYQSSLLGKHLSEPLRFQTIPGGEISSAMTEIDPGRHLHFIFFLDGLDGFLESGFAGGNAAPESLSKVITHLVAHAATEGNARPGFINGLTLIVSCGYGRGFAVALDPPLPEKWRLEFVAAQDLDTLNWLPEFDALALWRVLDQRDVLAQEGVELLNANGLLNLVAVSRGLDGHLIPHGRIPEDFGEAHTKKVVILEQNALRGLRHEVATQWSPRCARDGDGHWVSVRKTNASLFADEKSIPFYASEQDVMEGRLRGVYVATRRPWWIEIAAPASAPRDGIFQHWSMLTIWLRRAAPLLDASFESLPTSAITYRVSFEEIVETASGEFAPKSIDELRSLIAITANRGEHKIDIRVRRGYHEGFLRPENAAERLLAEALVVGAAELAGEQGDRLKIQSLVERIAPDTRARHIHLLPARSFRDHAFRQTREEPTLIDKTDDATHRIGLGWKARPPERSAHISGIAECTSYLNQVVQLILDQLCGMLHQLDRQSFVSIVLQNYESAAHDRDVWKRTTDAVLAVHDDKDETVQTIIEHQGRIHSCFTASRILLEAAICECPLQGGRAPGRLDLSRAMALAIEAYQYGGWSDAIHWGAIAPKLRITPLGDIHIHHDFIEMVYEPFGRAVGHVTVQDDAKSYSKLYQRIDETPSASAIVEPQFLAAWQAEFGVSLDGLLAFVGRLAKVDSQPVQPVTTFQRSELVGLVVDAAGVSETTASACLDLLTLCSRPAWRTASDGFVEKDWVPWRFRRRLSVLRRPFIAIDTARFILAPAAVEDALLARVRSFHGGEVPQGQVRSPEMRKWIGHANHLQRKGFNTKVAERMRELGWHSDAEVRVTKILRRSLDRDYGDVDVLAWQPHSGRVLAMECKDLQFHKTMGEISEQLADFRGNTNSEGKRDVLRRHLDRVDILAAHADDVAKSLRLPAAKIEGHLVFKNPVPMRFARNRMMATIKLSLFAELDQL